jgi:hypothetical protein
MSRRAQLEGIALGRAAKAFAVSPTNARIASVENRRSRMPQESRYSLIHAEPENSPIYA